MTPVRPNSTEINAADIEHVGAMLAGALLLATGIRKSGITGFLYKVAGAGLVYRGQQGYSRLYRAFGLSLCEGRTGIGRLNDAASAEIEIDRPPEDLYRVWRNFENLPVFMDNLLSVHELDDHRSMWVARAPLGTVIKWEAVVINDVENELIAWETLEGSGVDHVGSVRFEPVGPGRTRLRIRLRYDPPADALGIALAKVFGKDPQRQIEKDLKRFKAIMEVEGVAKSTRPMAKAL